MRSLKHFTGMEWARCAPLVYAFKQVRDDARLALYKKTHCVSLNDFLEKTRGLEGRNIALVVAFEQPWAVDWLLRMARQNLTDTDVMVFDNSRRFSARADIEQVCRSRSIPYLSLPPNPIRHPSRSHGMAMT